VKLVAFAIERPGGALEMDGKDKTFRRLFEDHSGL